MFSWRKIFVAILTMIFFYSIITSLINVSQGPTTFEEQMLYGDASFPSITICPMTNGSRNISFETVMRKINETKNGLFTRAYLWIDNRENKA